MVFGFYYYLLPDISVDEGGHQKISCTKRRNRIHSLHTHFCVLSSTPASQIATGGTPVEHAFTGASLWHAVCTLYQAGQKLASRTCRYLVMCARNHTRMSQRPSASPHGNLFIYPACMDRRTRETHSFHSCTNSYCFFSLLPHFPCPSCHHRSNLYRYSTCRAHKV